MNDDILMDNVTKGSEILRERFPYMSENEALLIAALSQHFTLLAMARGTDLNKITDAIKVSCDYMDMLYSLVSAVEKRCMEAKTLKDIVNGN